MNVLGKTVVVTGGANGIGRALCRQFAAEGAKVVIVADIDRPAAEEVARAIEGGEAIPCNVASESEVAALVDHVLKVHGPIDLFCNNAGIGVAGGCDVPNHDWQRTWEINVMAHVYGARAVLPSMLARRHGYFLQTASAAGLLTQIGSAPYAVTKHAAIAFAEWLAITHGDDGIGVSVLCPQGVRTHMLELSEARTRALLDANALDPQDVAKAVVQGLAEENFLILPHPEVLEYFRRKAGDYDRWLRGMRRLQASVHEVRSGTKSN
jgi:NAD(P)-dependent dehydrogenase (short-subunit alcohol dehydrogenase family)